MAAKLAGGKRSKFDLGQNSDINVTPFVDVMLVLLIIFMVTAPLATVSIKLDLPPAKAPPPSQKEKPPTYISIDNDGNLFVSFSTSPTQTEMRRVPSIQNLSQFLAASLAVPNPTSQRVFIRADQHVKYRKFMDVLNQLETDGYFKIGLISEEVQS
ncbi:MAG: biopolymer transporter ExbD [Caulobacteraceae bacterium]|nr:biopolymer transporter ExbD [Caulobacteraceae bacterium]